MSPEEFQRASRLALQNRDYRRLVHLCQAMRKVRPAYADAWFLESVAAEAGRNIAAAVKLVDQALTLDPKNGEYLVQKARYHASAGQMGEARESAEAALTAGASGPSQLNTLGVVFTRLGAHQAAAKALRQSVEASATNPHSQFNLAAAEQFLGNDDAARFHYEEAIRLQPTNARSYWALSELDKNAVSERYEAAMRKLASSPSLSVNDALYLAHALARIDEHRGDYATAIQRLSEAKARRRAQLNYRFDEDRQVFDALHDAYPGEVTTDTGEAPGASAEGTVRPLFIVGLPRTGTTLLERMLCAHDAVDTLGELQDLPMALKRLSRTPGPRVLSPEVIAATATAPITLREAYLDSIAIRMRELGSGLRYHIDKTPLNALLLGHIARHLPDAKIILLRRHAMDAGLSNYRQLFSLEYSYYNYSYDLEDTGRYIAAFEALMAHWHRVLGSRMHILDYEDLVAEPEQRLRDTLNYLELPWQDACLNFHERGGAVATPSNSQVRQPVYRTAVERWKRYGDALRPLRDALDRSGYEYQKL